MLRLGLRQILGMECRVCRQLLSVGKEDRDTRVFGALDWGVCPCCRQPVAPPAHRDANYRRRARRWVRNSRLEK